MGYTDQSTGRRGRPNNSQDQSSPVVIIPRSHISMANPTQRGLNENSQSVPQSRRTVICWRNTVLQQRRAAPPYQSLQIRICENGGDTKMLPTAHWMKWRGISKQSLEGLTFPAKQEKGHGRSKVCAIVFVIVSREDVSSLWALPFAVTFQGRRLFCAIFFSSWVVLSCLVFVYNSCRSIWPLPVQTPMSFWAASEHQNRSSSSRTQKTFKMRWVTTADIFKI